MFFVDWPWKNKVIVVNNRSKHWTKYRQHAIHFQYHKWHIFWEPFQGSSNVKFWELGWKRSEGSLNWGRYRPIRWSVYAIKYANVSTMINLEDMKFDIIIVKISKKFFERCSRRCICLSNTEITLIIFYCANSMLTNWWSRDCSGVPPVYKSWINRLGTREMKRCTLNIFRYGIRRKWINLVPVMYPKLITICSSSIFSYQYHSEWARWEQNICWILRNKNSA